MSTDVLSISRRMMLRPVHYKDADILLINIPQRDYHATSPRLENERVLPPIGLGYLATYLEARGIRAAILDAEFFGISRDEIVSVALAFNAPAIGLNCYSPTAPITYDVANRLADRGRRIFIGGVHATYCQSDVREHCPTAEILAGYAEEALYQALAKTVPATEPTDPLSLWLSRPHLAADPHTKRGRITSCLLSSRGCPYSCTFCTSAQTAYRLRPVADVIAEMVHLRRVHNVSHFQFLDDLFLSNPRRTADFATDLRSSDAHGCSWQGLSTVRTLGMHVAQDAVRVLAASGCTQLSIGFESGTERVRALAGKAYDERLAIRCVEACRDHGIRTKGFFMVGFPGETADEIQATVRFISTLGAQGLTDISLFQVKLYPGTQLYAAASKSGKGAVADDYYEYDLRSTATATAAMRAFSRENYGNRRQLSELTPQQLETVIQDTTGRFYQSVNN